MHSGSAVSHLMSWVRRERPHYLGHFQGVPPQSTPCNRGESGGFQVCKCVLGRNPHTLSNESEPQAPILHSGPALGTETTALVNKPRRPMSRPHSSPDAGGGGSQGRLRKATAPTFPLVKLHCSLDHVGSFENWILGPPTADQLNRDTKGGPQCQ